MAFLNRFQGVLLAFLLMVLLAGRVESLVTTQAVHQIDFWLVWLGCMVVLTLPILLLESALAKRTKALPLQALPALTRDADASTRWRSVGWLGLGAVLLLAGALSSALSLGAAVLAKQSTSLEVITPALPFVIIAAVVGLSYISKCLPLAGTLLIIVLISLRLFDPILGLSWQPVHLSFIDWSSAIELALMATGVGLGIYWQMALMVNATNVRYRVLTIWVAQIIGGAVIALDLLSITPANKDLGFMLYGFAVLSGTAILFGFARQQLMARGFPVIVTWIILLASLLVWVLPIQGSLLVLTLALAIIVPATYAIFAGWKMKSSHLRKALDFNNEGLYNLWRVLVRLVVPLAVVIALIGLVQQYIVWIH